MKCRGCGQESFDLFETCRHCAPAPVPDKEPPAALPTDPADDLLSLRFEPERSAPGPGVPGRRPSRATAVSNVARGADFVEMLDDDAMEVGEDDLDWAPSAGPPFRIDDDLFSGYDPGVPEEPGAVDVGQLRDDWPAPGADFSDQAFVLPNQKPGPPADVEPIIDRDDEVPERYWAPEVADLHRRALALLVDQLLLLAVLGVFFLGALMALQRNGLTTGLSLGTPGLQASVLPFVLLAALLSLTASVYFHGSTGRTPGKALVGVEVRNGDGGAVTWGRATLRWLGAALGLACGGVGVFWALFEPRRRGWADLVSGTVVARPQREATSRFPAVDNLRGPRVPCDRWNGPR